MRSMIASLRVAIATLLALQASFALAVEPQDWIDTHLSGLVKTYQWLHSNPEPSYQEKERPPSWLNFGKTAATK